MKTTLKIIVMICTAICAILATACLIYQDMTSALFFECNALFGYLFIKHDFKI